MITFFIICVLTTLYAMAYTKNWFKIGEISDSQHLMVRVGLAMAGFLSLYLMTIIHREGSFFGGIMTYVGASCGVISSYVVVEKAILKEKPIFSDDVSLIGTVAYHNWGSKACQWLYVVEVIFYLTIVLL